MSKPVQGNEIFLTKVTVWQRQLGLVDAALSTWQDVQKMWQALESIYIGSDDIRRQLPEDAKRFNTINGQFKVSSISPTQLYVPLPGTCCIDCCQARPSL
jgi:hypothetical protein